MKLGLTAIKPNEMACISMHPTRIAPHWFFAISMIRPAGTVADPLETCRMAFSAPN